MFNTHRRNVVVCVYTYYLENVPGLNHALHVSKDNLVSFTESSVTASVMTVMLQAVLAVNTCCFDKID